MDGEGNCTTPPPGPAAYQPRALPCASSSPSSWRISSGAGSGTGGGVHATCATAPSDNIEVSAGAAIGSGTPDWIGPKLKGALNPASGSPEIGIIAWK